MASEWRDLRRQLEEQGFTCELRKSGHWLIRNPDGRIITTLGSTPSEYRGLKNAIAALRRAGFVAKRK